jgi:hypothetical protein
MWIRSTAASDAYPNWGGGISGGTPAFGVYPRPSPEQPRGDQHCQHDGCKLGHSAGIGTIQQVIHQGAIVVAGIEDLVQDTDCQHAVQCGTHDDPMSSRTTTPKISKQEIPTSTESADT